MALKTALDGARQTAGKRTRRVHPACDCGPDPFPARSRYAGGGAVIPVHVLARMMWSLHTWSSMAPAQEGKCVLREGTPNGKGSAHGNERAAIRHRDRAHGDHLIERGKGRRGQFRHAERPCRRRLRRLPCRRRRGTHLEGDERFQPSGGEEGGRAQDGSADHYKVEVVSPILRYGDIETLQEIVRALRHEGAFANDSRGTHAQDAAHALQHRGQQGGPSLPRPRGWAEPRRATGTRTARRRSAVGGTRRPRSPGSRTGARPGTSTWTTRRGPPPSPRPCAWRCRARTSRPPRRRARGPPGSSALKTEVSH